MNRSYKKLSPFRSAELITIITENDRAYSYFKWFASINPRIRVHTINEHDENPTYSYFVDILGKIRDNNGVSSIINDKIWFICDTNKWYEQIDILYKIIDRLPNCNIALSNPCFEVWLYFHSIEESPKEGATCTQLENFMSISDLGIYNPDIYCLNIHKAYLRASRVDETPDDFFPKVMKTKIYKLAWDLLAILGDEWKHE